MGLYVKGNHKKSLKDLNVAIFRHVDSAGCGGMGRRAMRFFGPFGMRSPSGARGLFFLFPCFIECKFIVDLGGKIKNTPRRPLGSRTPKGPKNRKARQPIPPHPALELVRGCG